MQELFDNRRLQVTLPSILVGTRFKFFDTTTDGKSVRLPTVCRLCGERDSLMHLLGHTELDPKPPTCPEGLIRYLVTMAQSVDVINPHLSFPSVPETSMELELDAGTDSDEESAGVESLSFESATMEILS